MGGGSRYSFKTTEHLHMLLGTGYIAVSKQGTPSAFVGRKVQSRKRSNRSRHTGPQKARRWHQGREEGRRVLDETKASWRSPVTTSVTGKGLQMAARARRQESTWHTEGGQRPA